jgi:preprotein translocase subunit SecG
MMDFLFWGTLVLFITVSILLILLILIQKGRGGGLASAFGGAGGSTAFGSKTGDVLTWATSILFGVFLLLAIVLNLTSNKRDAATQRANVVAANAALPPGTPAIPPAGMGTPSTQPAKR